MGEIWEGERERERERGSEVLEFLGDRGTLGERDWQRGVGRDGLGVGGGGGRDVGREELGRGIAN